MVVGFMVVLLFFVAIGAEPLDQAVAATLVPALSTSLHAVGADAFFTLGTVLQAAQAGIHLALGAVAAAGVAKVLVTELTI
jgi:hypothetical protein